MSAFSNNFAKHPAAKNFCPSKNLAKVKYDLANGATQDANESYECNRRKRALNVGNAVGDGECQICCENIHKFALFFDKN